MKTFFFLLLISISSSAFCQIDKLSPYEINLYNKYSHTLASKTVLIQVGSRFDKDFGTGSAFIVNKNGKLYLITNYHLIPGYDANDTTILYHTKRRADVVYILFHLKNPTMAILLPYKLYNRSGKRLFYTIPNQKSKDIFPKSITDLSILPLGSIDKRVFIDTVRIWDKSDPYASRGSIASIWGFRYNHGVGRQYPMADTGIVLANNLNINGRYLIVMRTHKFMSGDSGAPVYLSYNNDLIFLGINSSESGCGNLLSGYDDFTKNQNAVFIIPKKTIRDALIKLVK
ncbi:MAG: hypothetical protein JWR09_1532 [Mucilaginibacter sp.]|nr:hypothetical protein [Mucilaginibacter sp.]